MIVTLADWHPEQYPYVEAKLTLTEPLTETTVTVCPLMDGGAELLWETPATAPVLCRDLGGRWIDDDGVDCDGPRGLVARLYGQVCADEWFEPLRAYNARAYWDGEAAELDEDGMSEDEVDAFYRRTQRYVAAWHYLPGLLRTCALELADDFDGSPAQLLATAGAVAAAIAAPAATAASYAPAA